MASEVINLAEFNLDTKKLVDSLNNLQDAYFDLKKAQKEQSDQYKANAKEIDTLTKANDLLASSKKDESKAIEENKKKIDELTASQRELQKSEQNLGIQIGTVKKEINQTTTQLRAYQDAEGKTKSLIDLGNEALSRQIKNKNDARAANIALNNVANQLNPNIEEEATLLKQLNAQMDKNTEFIKENSSETAKQKMNIGNYQSALDGVDSVLEKFGVNGQQARTVVTGFSNTILKASDDITNYAGNLITASANMIGFKTSSQLASETTIAQTTATEAQIAATTTQAVATETQTAANVAMAASSEGVAVATTASTLSLKAFTVALAATGIGLIVIALGVLFNYLKELDPLIDKIEQGFAGLGAAVRVLGQAIATLSFDGLGESMARAAKEAANLKEAQQDLADLQRSQEVANARASQQYDELILKSKNRTLSEKERIAFLKQAEAIESANYKQRTNLVNRDMELALESARLKGQLSKEEIENLKNNSLAYGNYLLNKGKITDAELEALKKAELDRIAIDAENTKRLEKNQNAQDKLFEDAQKKREKDEADRKDKAQKEIDRLLALSKAEIELFKTTQGFKKQSTEDELKFNQELYERELKDLKLQNEKKKLTNKEYQASKAKLDIEYARINAEILLENANLELDAQIEKNNRILANDGYLSQQQFLLKQQALADNLKAENDFAKLRLEQGVINQKEYDAEIRKIEQETYDRNKALQEQRLAAEQEASLINLENQKVINEENFLAQAEIEKAQNEIKRQQEVAAAEKSGADVSLINAKYAEIDKQIEEAKQDNKVKLASNAFGALASIFGAESKAGKAAAIAQTTIDTYQSAISAFKSLSGIPIVGPTLGAIAAGAAIKSGLDAVKKITSTKTPEVKQPSYASGVIGIRGAGSATSDNISANLSAGESVINAKSTGMFANELAAINQAGGGVGINGASNILNQNQIDNNVNNTQMAQMISEAVAVGAELGTSKGSQNGIRSLSDDRKVMADAKF